MSPALCAIVLRPTRKRLNIFYRAFNWTYGKGRDFYIRLLQATVRRSVMALPVFAVLAAAAYWGFSSMPTGFLPSEDQGYAMLSVQLPDASSKSRTNAVVANINEKLAAMPGIESWISVTGYSLLDGATSPNAGAYWIIFDPWKEREKRGLGLKTILGMLWQQGSTIEEASVAAFPPPAIIGLGEAGGFQVQLQDRGNLGLPALEQITEEMVRDANGQAALKGVFSTFRANVPQLFADIDRTQAKTLDVQLSAIFDTLQAYLGSVYVNDFNKFGRTYQVNIQADAPFRRRIEDIRQLEVRNAHGDMVPLGAVLRVKATQGPQIINRFNMYPSAALNGEAAPGFSSGQAISVIEKMAATKLPANTGFEWTGMAYQEKAAGGQAMGIFMMAVTFVYLVLCAQYESWSIPLSVILVVPLGLLGTVIGLTARGMDVNMYTQIGIVLLIGMACKTAILIVEFAKANRESGKTIQEAAMEASVVRFRPIVMTGAAFISGVFPLVIASGAGAASRQALGTAVFGGMIAATALMVIFVPAFYVVIQSLSERLRPQRAASPQKSKAEDRLLDPGR
jgi:HAE1 family hydrophobic/amphiphilic exporter-1